MRVEFVARTEDLKRAAKHLLLNRRGYTDTDFAELLVSAYGATFRTVGAETEIPVNGLRPGSARLPLKVLERIVEIARRYQAAETKILVEPGSIKIGRTTQRHPDIEITRPPGEAAAIPADASILDTLAVASLLTPEEIIEQGLRQRVEVAQQRSSDAIENAAAALRELGVPVVKLQELVDSHVAEVAEKLKTAIRQA